MASAANVAKRLCAVWSLFFMISPAAADGLLVSELAFLSGTEGSYLAYRSGSWDGRCERDHVELVWDVERLRGLVENLERRVLELERELRLRGETKEPEFVCSITTPLNGSFLARDVSERAARTKVLQKCEEKGTAFCPASQVECDKAP